MLCDTVQLDLNNSHKTWLCLACLTLVYYVFFIFPRKPRQDLSWSQSWHQSRKFNQLKLSRLCNLNPLHHRHHIQIWTCSRRRLSLPVSPSHMYRRHSYLRNRKQHSMSTNQRHTWWVWRETHPQHLTHRMILLYQASQKHIRRHNLLNQKDRQGLRKLPIHHCSSRQQLEPVLQKRKKKIEWVGL